jgi:hypothetical protein
MPYAQFTDQQILNGYFGNCFGKVRTQISAAATAQTTINTGSFASGGTSGNMDTTPSTTAMIFVGTPGSGTTQNVYTAPHSFLLTNSAATSLTIASQSIGLQISVADIILGMGTGAQPAPWGYVNTWYIGLTTQAVSGATQANVLSNEPSSTGGYARIVVPNIAANWSAATYSSPTATTASAATFSFPASTGSGWSTGATNLVQVFLADSSTLAGGNVFGYGALTTPQAVNASGITLSFASTALTVTLS